jgi:hypothetical protein
MASAAGGAASLGSGGGLGETRDRGGVPRRARGRAQGCRTEGGRKEEGKGRKEKRKEEKKRKRENEEKRKLREKEKIGK